jgi:F-type H+-transporting ATPase subunit b
VLIDWPTVIAQIVNFLILVLLLKRFLYGPIIEAMDEREAKIAADLAAAEEKRQTAAQEIEEYRRRNQALADERAALMRQAEADVTERRRELMHEARQVVDEAKRRWQRAIEQEKTAFLQELRQRAGEQVYRVARQALADLANQELEEQLVSVFIERLETLPAAESGTFAAASDGAEPVVITSAFELSEAVRRRLSDLVQNHLANGRSPTFAVSPDLIAGIELRAPGYKIAWSVADYLDTLEESVSAALHHPVILEAAGERA